LNNKKREKSKQEDRLVSKARVIRMMTLKLKKVAVILVTRRMMTIRMNSKKARRILCLLSCTTAYL
jgi:hypothetical protein